VRKYLSRDILTAPVRAGIVEKPEDFLYSNARNYSGLKWIIEVDYWRF